MNRISLATEFKNSLKKERIYYESDHTDEFIDKIIKDMEHINIYYIYSNKASNSIKFWGEDAVIIWDLNYWKLFQKYLLQVENCKRFNKNLIQGIIGIISEFISDKYKSIPEISMFVKQISDIYGVKIQVSYDDCINLQDVVEKGKLFSLFHEIGHLEYHKQNNELVKVCEELVRDMFCSIVNKDLSSLGEWAVLGRKSVLHIKYNKNEELLEEITADTFAVMNMVNYFKNSDNKSNFQLACECAIAIEYLSAFQVMFNAVNEAWDVHYPEMKLRFPVRKHKIDSYINELAVARDGLCGQLLVIIIQRMFYLDKNECKRLWDCIDDNHVDNSDIISCLADDEFICTAIEDAFS